MPTIQLILDRETSAKLAFLAERTGRRKVDVAIDLLTKVVSQEYKDVASVNLPQQVPVQRPVSSPRPRRQPILYNGPDLKGLQMNETYSSYAEILRIIRPDLAKLWPEGKLYCAKNHGGDKAENIIKRYEGFIYENLIRIPK